ncbi:MAG: penicillin-binding transpeptidase domain-containing protein [Oscillospiraceae bacterium]|nr:penicillin-binding transpeptidase domain-containing protein [Oscillospiraceae bacterium]
MSKSRRRDARPTKQILSRTLVLMVVCGVLAFVALGAQLFRIQILDHDELERRAIAQQVREITVAASRGTIFDASGTVLAQSASVENVFISPADIYYHQEDQQLIARGLSRILEVDEEMVLERMQNIASQFQTIRNHIDRDMADEVRAFIVEHDLKSVHLQPASQRYFPRERTAAHVLGFVGAEGTGMGYGVEGSYDNYLTGINGRVVRLKTSTGVDMLRAGYEDYFSAQPGDDLHLTIDVNIQQIMERHIAQAVQDFDLRNGGFAVAMQPHTGAILGMVSLGDFNPNSHGRLSEERMEALRQRFPDNDEAFWAAVSEELENSWMNKVTGYTYEPGSTFKLVTFAIALEEGIITMDSERTFYCRGYMDVRGRTEPLNCWRRTGHGALNMRGVMQQSCNIGTVTLAMEVGPDVFFEYLRAFGMMETTGIDLNGEGLGMVWSEDTWNFYIDNNNFSSLAAASFGQTFTMTPLRMATATSALVNGGYIVEPFVVEQVVAEDGTIVRANETRVRRQVISRETSLAVLDLMEASVGDPVMGTGRNAYVQGFRIGGKTGTTIDTVREVQYGVTEYILSFVGAAPIDDPEIVLLVSLQDPGPNSSTHPSGGQMAAPVVGQMLAEILPYLGVEPRLGTEVQRVNVQVPYIRRRTVEEARAELEAEGLAVRIKGEGERVVDQVPAGGAVVVAGTEVILYLDNSRQEEMVTVPDITGMNYPEARAALEANGLHVRRSGTVAEHDAVRVYSQSRPAADVVRRGTVIQITMIDTTRDGFF